MFKRPVIFLLLICMLIANFSKLFVYAGYEMNQKYIATTLCQNRAKPWLHCNGKCFLIKRIQQAEQKERAEERSAAKNLFQDAIPHQTAGIKFSNMLLGVIYTPYSSHASINNPASIFRPPQV